MTQTATQRGILDSFSRAAYLAHYWTSFSPDRRGEQLIKDYTAQLEEDIKELEAEEISSDTIADYIERYKKLFGSWLNAKSRCASTMITGSANFNVRRAEKANRSEERHYELFQEWRNRAKKAITRKAKPEKTFLSEIDRYKAELESMKANHEKMKEGNRRIMQARKNGEDITQYLTDTFGIQPHMIEWTLKFGFGLQNNNANMRRVEQRIKDMEAKENRANTIGQKEFLFDGFKVIYNHEADRIQIQHDTKPDREVIYTLKSNGFRWSPSFAAWQRQLNTNGLWAAERVLKIQLPKLTTI
jgi:hypothetical protein